MEISDQLYAPVALSPRISPPVTTLDRRLCRRETPLPLPVDQTPVLQPAARLYTD
jgi:hypothetical protein